MLEQVLYHLRPFVLSRVTGVKSRNGREIPGWIILVPLTAKQLLKHPHVGRKRVIQGLDLAERLGVRLAGLGALLAPLTNHGLDLLGKTRLRLTTGNALTTAVLIEDLRRIIAAAGMRPRQTTVAVIGATGAIGWACAELLNGRVGRLLIFGRSESSLDTLAEGLEKTDTEIVVSRTIRSLREADLVVVTTGGVGAVFHPGDLKGGAIVYDITYPCNVPNTLLEERPDVVVLEGGRVSTPGIDCSFGWFGLRPETTFACLAETICLAQAGENAPCTLGRPTREQVEAIERIARGYGFSPADPCSLGRPMA